LGWESLASLPGDLFGSAKANEQLEPPTSRPEAMIAAAAAMLIREATSSPPLRHEQSAQPPCHRLSHNRRRVFAEALDDSILAGVGASLVVERR
jgi:hypothetical protein